MARVFVDTSGIYALLDRDDKNHAEARRAFERAAAGRSEPVITNFIVAECHALLLVRLGAHVARRWLLENVWHVERVSADDEAEAFGLIEAHADKTYSYADATSFAVMRRLRLRKVVTFDRHFEQYGFERV